MTSTLVFWIIAVFAFNNLCMVANYFEKKALQKTIEAQQATIQKLLNREPVTYKEVGQEQPKPDTDSYSAWSGQMMDRNDSTS